MEITGRSKIEVGLINLIILLYLFRATISVLKYPFILLFPCFIIYTVFVYQHECIKVFKSFFRKYILFLILFAFLVFAFLISNKIYLLVLKDLANALILISFIFILSVVVKSKMHMEFFIYNFVHLVIFFALIISFTGFMDLFSVFPGEKNINASDVLMNSISKDYNFSLVPIYLGIASLLYLLIKEASTIKILLYNVLFLFFSLNIILSGSRRGIILLLIVFGLLLILKIINLVYRSNDLKAITSKSNFLFFSLIFVPLCLSLFFFKGSIGFKNRALKNIGVQNILLVKTRLASNVFRYVQTLDKEITYINVFEKIWGNYYDPKDPDSGWGNKIHTTVYPLIGNNVEIVPNDVRGYKLDNHTDANYYKEIDLSEAYSIVGRLKVKKGDHYYASVFCYVSEDFDGNNVYFGNSYLYLNNNTVFGNPFVNFNLKNKGRWNKLEIEFDCNDGITELLVSITKNGVKGFSDLKGYVIFAYPVYHKKDSINDLLNLPKDVAIEFPYRLPVRQSSVNYSSIVPLNLCRLAEITESKQDPFLHWINNLIREDTTYYPMKSKIKLDEMSTQFIGGRLLRWEFALQILLKEYNLGQILIGGSFNFMNWYGEYFIKDKMSSDYPHNPILSVLLYSGLIGLFFYFLFLYKIFFYYWKYHKQCIILFIFFLITFFFSFFSAGSPFDPPIMGFFSVLPFFINSILKNEKAKEE